MRIISCIAASYLALRLSLILFPLPLATLESDYSAVALDSDHRLLRITLSPRGAYRIRLPLADMSEDLKTGFLQYEDRHFYRHLGINPIAVVRSAWCNLRHRRVVMGGSTITMQIAKMMEPRRRTIGAKVIEAFRAIQLETRYSKRELLEIYLNLIPMGGNIEGVGAASYLYFGKPASALSFSESALLIGIPRSPARFRPDRHPDQARVQWTSVVGRLQGRPSPTFDLPKGRFANPFKCPHLVQRVRSLADSTQHRLTIDPQIQALAERHLRESVARLSREGSHNGAVLVIDNRTMKVLAYVGSPDFSDRQHGGQINGAAIQRSPGSLLKPFLYGLGVDRGLITPRKRVYDIDRNYDGYVPANFDRHFTGPVAADEALGRSLNVPAVNLEYELGEEGLLALIQRAHLFDGKRAERAPGLSLVLGAYPLTLEELVRLYAIFPNEGRFRDLIFFDDEDERPNAGIALLSPEAAYVTADMLAKVERPDLPQSWEFTASRARIAFKTGTSFGLRDAWSVGFTPRYTVGVWLGNVDAKSSSALIGIQAAAPLLVALLNDLTRFHDEWLPRPAGVRVRPVCAVSGEPAGPACPSKVDDLFIPGRSASAPCSLHKRITIRRADGVEVCRACMNGRRADYREQIVEMWPPDVATFLRRRGERHVVLPKHNPQCHAVDREGTLKVRSPLAGGFYAVTPALSAARQKIPLMAQTQSAAETVFWYVDDRLVGRGAPDRVFYVEPSPGRHRVTLMDTRGHVDSVEFKVRRAF